ncbi:hypothetical protein MPTK1_2g02340 [Marchantia polymorpha subsp. ruderalis]|uniref:VWFA domain-containing protein n=1 Tax=Marchantia polymorpha TaxID=3197 RepID=A0A2R6W8B6_MARPO|nr:hypothetical protein MARPO_0130s0041 [Marchantia polymorpha]BBN00814.1 hypothetical protein Mp_2g02340 [Marchantia polymorpha subsp. ruderalis]|eukprot:PTQ30091.1 hypothetical protein MARPO_0130s0041 [Marchantia polymorpha]
MYFNTNTICGIGHRNDRGDLQWLPRIALTAEAVICQNSSRLTLKQTFVNSEKKALDEAVYTFPLYEGAAVVAFTCTIQDQVIVGKIKDKCTARQVYESAKAKGNRAALLAERRPDIWTTEVCTIPAGAKVEVEITLVAELKHDSQVDGIRFVLPTNIAPRYGELPDMEAMDATILSDSKGFELTIAVTMTSAITSMQSPSHPIVVGMGTHSPSSAPPKGQNDVCKGFVTLSQKDTALDKDFVLIVSSADVGQPQAIVETHPTLGNNQRAVLLSLVPKFQIPRISPEIVFIADRSGSMDTQIPQLRNALTVFLKSLPVGVKFNICSFGSSHSFLWPKSMPYDQANLDVALKHVRTFEADLGGTEMFPPMEDALKKRYKDLPTEIIFLTDGEIYETEPLLDLVQRECAGGDVRVFSLGIGDSVSHALVEGLARAGRGYAQIVGIDDKLDVKVVRMLKAALWDHVKDYKLSFSAADCASPATTTATTKSEHDADEAFEMVEHEESSTPAPKSDETPPQPTVISLYDESASADAEIEPPASKDRFAHLAPLEVPTRIQTPHRVPPLYPFSRTNVYVLLSGGEPTPRVITVSGTTNSGIKLELQVPVKDVGTGTTVHHLAAKKLLQELEEGGSYLHSGEFGVDPQTEPGKFVDVVEREGVRVGLTFGVAGKWTSFVAVELEEPEFEASVYDTAYYSSGRQPMASPMPMPMASPAVVTFCSLRSAPMRMSKASARIARLPQNPPQTAGFGAMGSPESAQVELLASGSKVESQGSESEVESQGSESEVELLASASEVELLASDKEELTEDPPESKAYQLMRWQAFDGSFPSGSGEWANELIKAFEQWIPQQQQSLETATLAALPRDVLEKLVASAVATAIFEVELKDSQGVWEMVVEKTDDWGVQTAGEAAWNAVKTWASQQVVTAGELKTANFWAK